MYISRVRIEGIRGFRAGPHGVDLDLRRPDGTLAGWTVIAGRNGAGKTTFLRAIALAVAGSNAAVRLMVSFAGWIREGEQQGSVQVNVLPTPLDGDRSWKTDDSLDLQLVWKPESSGLHEGVQRQGEPVIESSLDLTQANDLNELTSLAQPGYSSWATQPRGWFIAAYGPFRRLSGHTLDALRLMMASGHVSRLVSLFREDASLGDCIEWLKIVNHRRLEGQKGARELEEAVLGLLDDGLLPDGARVSRVDSTGLWVEQGGVRLPLEGLSDGYRTVVTLIIDIARQMYECYGELPVIAHGGQHGGHLAVDLPGVVLIDEVDAHLHVSWQQRIGFWLKQRFPRVQFIVSTHSPFVCQAADSRGLIRLPAPGEERVAEHVPDELFREVVNGSVEDAVLTDLFGLEHSRSPAAEQKVEELARLEATVLEGGASAPEKARYRALKAELPLGPSHEVERVLLRLEKTLEAPPETGNGAGRP